MQVGLVIGMAGLGLLIVSSNIDKEIAPPMLAMGVLAISIGAGFVLSAIVSYGISRRLGLWNVQQARHAE